MGVSFLALQGCQGDMLEASLVWGSTQGPSYSDPAPRTVSWELRHTGALLLLLSLHGTTHFAWVQVTPPSFLTLVLQVSGSSKDQSWAVPADFSGCIRLRESHSGRNSSP